MGCRLFDVFKDPTPAFPLSPTHQPYFAVFSAGNVTKIVPAAFLACAAMSAEEDQRTGLQGSRVLRSKDYRPT